MKAIIPSAITGLACVAITLLVVLQMAGQNKELILHDSFLPEQHNSAVHIGTPVERIPAKPRSGTLINLIMEYEENQKRERFQSLLERNASATDPELIRLIKDLLDPPSSHPVIKLARPIIDTPQSKEVVKYLAGKRNGFFIECGALDGERSSNTISLEQNKGWTGVLIEMDPFFYAQLRGKSRKSHSINACLSPSDHPTQLPFAESSLGTGQLSKSPNQSLPMVPCFPLESILMTLNRTHVDYFSLDVEGAELEVLKTIPFDKITFDILSVEYIHGKGERGYVDFMASKGYKMLKKIHFSDVKLYLGADDLMFVKK